MPPRFRKKSRNQAAIPPETNVTTRVPPPVLGDDPVSPPSPVTLWEIPALTKEYELLA